MEKEKDEHLEITITPIKVPKNKIMKWLFWNVYWNVWNVWRLKFLSWFYLGVYKPCEAVINKLSPKK